ncbi:hypothetical protein F4775DRAFT_562528 [Biscogniauxia sp. FL1348]|nr:hypothetical protein F4775DRAFT_562528 [Biscogniauxia sp. FL1348]
MGPVSLKKGVDLLHGLFAIYYVSNISLVTSNSERLFARRFHDENSFMLVLHVDACNFILIFLTANEAGISKSF